MDARNAREWDQERQRREQRGLQFQNEFLGWDLRESPQSVPSVTRSTRSCTEYEYTSRNPILVDHLDPLDVDILNQRHAFDLPSQAVCDALVDVFFKWIAPVLPVINRHDFMCRYRNPQNPPSVLLLQAVLMVASRYHHHAQSSGNGVISPRMFYKKVKALYDAGYERDPTTVLQAVVLLGVYWDGPMVDGIFYWSRLGIALAQEHGLHQSENYVTLSAMKRRIWKRIWWTLYTRDRSVAAAFGRPLHINSEDCTVEPLEESDFIEYDEQSDGSTDRIAVLFFMQYVKLCQLMDLGLCLKLSSRSTEDSRMKGAAQCELGLNDWLVSCPSELQWRQSRHNFWSAILYSTFYTIVCQLHLLQSPDSSREAQSSAFHAATSIVSILETLQSRGELKYTPSFIICHAVVSFVTLRSQMEASIPSLLHAIRQNLEANLDMLQVLSHTWPIAAIFLELFRTMTGPEQFERMLSDAAEKCRKRSSFRFCRGKLRSNLTRKARSKTS
ncbi:transcription factor domain-containing protein [Aspergillus novofumigatus IBT 16806]|uniref:Putative fungal-specific transcription factor n=1 Tax=Aspergillus novofumigatus (strain IBT 16806) TaxID=1392255 RepID=A0A2I1C7R0_ASPN1|nr:putative fungal-specific transcription factor [Aspergillus novofumigatus IBT 16806]PKX93663.1 putative fungal-specific transcription factor [Aspergillus novofumigatus IBT 16806]